MKKNKLSVLLFIAAVVINLAGCQKPIEPGTTTGTVKITLTNTVKGNPLVLNTNTYSNPFAELYTVSKFKYYFSNIALSSGTGSVKENESYHLIDASKPESLSFSFSAVVGGYQSISFMIGVDSIKNVSGAQSGALDPTNDMFWTWSTGYIMAKFEGNSPASSQVNNKVEYHIGGFAGTDKVIGMITLTFPIAKLLDIRQNKISEILITTDLDKWWQNPNDIRIVANPVCTTPGALAKKIAGNYANMFTITDVLNN